MKKLYSKPEIMFESFTLSTNIAGDCERIVGNPQKGTCGIPGSAPGMNIFALGMDGPDGCLVINETDIHDGFCYDVPNNGPNLFNS